MKDGEVMDKSATPLFLQHIVAICSAYAREGSEEAAKRKFAILVLWDGAGWCSCVHACVLLDGCRPPPLTYLCAHLALLVEFFANSLQRHSSDAPCLAGRSGETAWMHMEGMEWIGGPFTCVKVEIPQSKTSKVKMVLFVAGQRQEQLLLHGFWGLPRNQSIQGF